MKHRCVSPFRGLDSKELSKNDVGRYPHSSFIIVQVKNAFMLAAVRMGSHTPCFME